MATDEPFAIEGRLSARRGNDAVAVAFTWTHTPPRDEFVVTTPLGGAVAEMSGDASTHRIDVRTADGRADAASDWATLTERVVGFPVPVDGLAFWAQGVPRPEAPHAKEMRRRRPPERVAPGWLRDRLRLRRRRGPPPLAAATHVPRSRVAHRHRSPAQPRESLASRRMRSLTVPAPAKLNLFLHVTGRRDDGYHLLETLMVALDTGDTITLTRRDDGAIERTTELPGVAPADDLAVRAALALKQETACPLGVDIAVTKRIPLGGGMGGGSSDAATCCSRSTACGICESAASRTHATRYRVGRGRCVFSWRRARARARHRRAPDRSHAAIVMGCRDRPADRGVDCGDFRGAGIDTKRRVGENRSLFRGLWAQ